MASYGSVLGSSQNQLIEPVVAPRFAFTCSEPLLKTLGDLASEMQVPIHSHICQQKEEVTKILSNYPQHRECASIFNAAGMLNSRVCAKFENGKNYCVEISYNLGQYVCVHVCFSSSYRLTWPIVYTWRSVR